MRTDGYEIEDDAILVEYFSGHISAHDLFFSEKRKLYSFIGLGMMIRAMKWAMIAKNEYDAIWWGRLRLLLNQAAESTIDEMDALPSRLRSYSRSDLKRLRHNLAKTGGCVTIDLLPDNIIATGPVAVERKFEAGLLLGLVLCPRVPSIRLCSSMILVLLYTACGRYSMHFTRMSFIRSTFLLKNMKIWAEKRRSHACRRRLYGQSSDWRGRRQMKDNNATIP